MARFDRGALTSNEHIRDHVLRHKIKLEQWADSAVARIHAALNATEIPVRVEIERALADIMLPNGKYMPFNAETNHKLAVLATKINDIRTAAITKAFDALHIDLEQLGPAEAGFMDALFHKVSPVKLKTKMPSKHHLKSIGRHTPI